MNIALLGYGKEGQAAEKYFKSKDPSTTFEIFQNFTPEEIRQQDFSGFDTVLRSPSVPPLHLKNESSMTKYFFNHCPCPIIGVTATKGKGTTCSLIKAILEALGQDVHLVGNIGIPSIEVLDQLTPNSVVVYEMSSFQLWDLEKSPHIAVVGTIEPDHLNVHESFDDYVGAKANICRHQTADDYTIYYKDNPDSVKIAEQSIAHKIPYPFEVPAEVLAALQIPGAHNERNAIAAIAAVASFKNLTPADFIAKHSTKIKQGFSNFKGLPHRLEFLREFNGIRYYDDNFSTTPTSTKVAVEAFPDDNVVLIVGGRDKTGNADLPEVYEIISAPQIKEIVLIGESGRELEARFHDPRFTSANSLEDAIKKASDLAKNYQNPIVMMSPAAASFDMFKDVYDRGAQFQAFINNLDK